jgi:hypothetical protein
VTDPRGVLDAAKTSADSTRTATVPSKTKLLDSLAAAPQSTDASGAPSSDVVRGLALAALAILGRTGDGMEAQYVALLDDPSSVHCLQLAKLNLNQCLAVAGPNYEDAYCAGRHAVSDTGKCISAAADGGPALDSAPAPRLQEADAIGREQASVYGKPAPRDEDEDDDDDDAPSAPAPALAAAPPPAPAPAPAPAQAPAPAPAPRQYAEAPAIQAPPAAAPAPAYSPPPQQTYNYARNDYPPPVQPAPYQSQGYQTYAQPQYAQPQPQYQQPQYVQPLYPQPQYAQPQYAQPQYQPQYAPQYQPQPYQQPYPQAQYAPQPYAQPQYTPQPYASPYPIYSGGQTYYPPPPQGYPAYRGYYYR